MNSNGFWSPVATSQLGRSGRVVFYIQADKDRSCLNVKHMKILRWFQRLHVVIVYLIPSWKLTYLIVSAPSRHFRVDDFPFAVWWDMAWTRSLEGIARNRLLPNLPWPHSAFATKQKKFRANRPKAYPKLAYLVKVVCFRILPQGQHFILVNLSPGF